MCGRIACALSVENLSCATACKSKNGDVYVKTTAHKSTLGYQPSFNIPPTVSIPVLVSAQHNCFQSKNEKNTDNLLVCMRFGIIPHWVKNENSKQYSLETHLCKIERMRESKLYNPLFEKGYRCAIPCVGYYEWQSTKGEKKQPYFFYNINNSKENLVATENSFNEKEGWTGVHLLYLAGIFGMYKNSDGDEAFSFAIITRETTDQFKYVHHRMPVVLQSDLDVKNWIDSTTTPSSAFEILKEPIDNLAAHPVDKNIVNKTKNNLAACIVPIELNKPTNKLMMSWLNDNKNNRCSPNKESSTKKRTSSLDSWLLPKQKKPKEK